jgi:chemotaxis protein CheY-P-specific phosphatase CheC
MKLQILVESKEVLQRLTKGTLPISIAWELKKFIVVVDPHLKAFEELKVQKIVELGVKKDDRTYEVKPENLGEFHKTMGELLSKDVEVTPPQVKIDSLKNFKDVNGNELFITTEDLIILDWLITE